MKYITITTCDGVLHINLRHTRDFIYKKNLSFINPHTLEQFGPFFTVIAKKEKQGRNFNNFAF